MGASTSKFQGTRTMPGTRFPKGFQQLTLSSIIQSPSPPADATMVLISVDTTDVRWRDDGTAPTGAAGMLMIHGSNYYEFPGVSSAMQFATTLAGVQTIALVADVAGSLNNKYFLFEDANSAHKYYAWFNINSAGTDPLIAGRTAVPITGATGASAATLGAALASAIAALNSTNSFTTSGTGTVTVTNKVVGPFSPAADGAAATGFTFAITTANQPVVNLSYYG